MEPDEIQTTDAQQEQCPLVLQTSELSLDRSAWPVELLD